MLVSNLTNLILSFGLNVLKISKIALFNYLFFFCFLLIPEITFSFNVISYYLQKAEY